MEDIRKHRGDGADNKDKCSYLSIRSCYLGDGFFQTRHPPHSAAEAYGGREHTLQGERERACFDLNNGFGFFLSKWCLLLVCAS